MLLQSFKDLSQLLAYKSANEDLTFHERLYRRTNIDIILKEMHSSNVVCGDALNEWLQA